MPKRWEELEKKLGPEREARVGRRAEQELGDTAQADDDPRSFVGFVKEAPMGLPLARDHDDHLDK